MTDFLDDHLGGREIIENNRSKDVTFIFNPRHPSNQLEAVNLPPSVQHLGTLDASPATDEEKEQLKLKVPKDEEENERKLKGNFELSKIGACEKHEDTKGISEAMFAGLPLLIKGVQTVKDAILAYNIGCDDILLTNHGGHQLDTTKTGLDTLLEIPGVREYALQHPENLTPPNPESAKEERRFEVWVDGGIWRGSDAVKTFCLRANTIGSGRGFLYANAVGASRALNIWRTVS
nr:hypothetical protein L203_05755 [Cryptococcus depauperatus CBS 7841]